MPLFGSNQLVTQSVEKFWAVKWKNVFYQRVFQKHQNFEKIQFFWPPRYAQTQIIKLVCVVPFF